MLGDLGRIFRESVAAFRAELNKREPEDEVAELLTAMRRELVEARAATKELTSALEQARAELAGERTLLEQCERRGQLAARIGDADTARVAQEFAARHRGRVQVMEQKVVALEAERALRLEEANEMKRRYEEADANRAALVAQLRRGAARQRIRTAAEDAESSFSEWARMEEKIGDTEAYADALEETSPPPPPGGASPAEVEARLAELKRRMGKE